jgi:hypothetical protein
VRLLDSHHHFWGFTAAGGFRAGVRLLGDAVLYGNAARIYQVDHATPLIPNGT